MLIAISISFLETEWFTFGQESGWVEATNIEFGSEAWDDGNTNNSDECKTPGSDGETSNMKICFFLYIWSLWIY